MNLSENKNELKTQNNEGIKCSFLPIREFTFLPERANENKKLGRYLKSSFHFGENAYPVGAYISVEDPIDKNLIPEREIFVRCVNYLNEKKKYQRKPTYGNLIPRSFEFKNDQEGKEYISCILTTDIKNNKLFWDSSKKKRGRKKNES